MAMKLYAHWLALQPFKSLVAQCNAHHVLDALFLGFLCLADFLQSPQLAGGETNLGQDVFIAVPLGTMRCFVERLSHSHLGSTRSRCFICSFDGKAIEVLYLAAILRATAFCSGCITTSGQPG